MKIVKETEDTLEILLENDKPTIFMLLKEELLKDENVLIAAWREDHPLLKNITFLIKTNGKVKARDALERAIRKSIERLNRFEESYKKVIDGTK